MTERIEWIEAEIAGYDALCSENTFRAGTYATIGEAEASPARLTFGLALRRLYWAIESLAPGEPYKPFADGPDAD